MTPAELPAPESLEAVLRAAAEAVLILDSEGRAVRLNPAAEQLFQAPALPAPLHRLSRALADQLAPALAAHPPRSLSARVTLEVGRDVAARLEPLLPAAGWVVTLLDVTQASNQTEAVRTAAHDLHNPLNLARGALNLLREQLPETTPPQRESLQMIQAGLDRIGRLIDDLLNLERVEAGGDLAPREVDLARLAADVVSEFRLEAETKGVELQFAGQAGTGQVRGDTSWLHRAAANLVSNAIKFTPAGGQVVVRCQAADGEARLEVSDTGPGISAAAQARLFQRFYRVRSEGTRHIPGTGLGLAIVKAVVERHGGRVWVSSVVGQGSTFGFAVPLLG